MHMLAPESICNIFKVSKPKSNNHNNKNSGHVVTQWGKYVGLAAGGKIEEQCV